MSGHDKVLIGGTDITWFRSKSPSIRVLIAVGIINGAVGVVAAIWETGQRIVDRMKGNR